MERNKFVVDVVGATIAMLIAAGFVHVYSGYANILIKFSDDHLLLTPACVFLRDYSHVGLFLPLIVMVLGSVMIVKKSPTGVAIVCQCGWLLTLGLICFTLVAWQISLIPMMGPLSVCPEEEKASATNGTFYCSPFIHQAPSVKLLCSLSSP